MAAKWSCVRDFLTPPPYTHAPIYNTNTYIHTHIYLYTTTVGCMLTYIQTQIKYSFKYEHMQVALCALRVSATTTINNNHNHELLTKASGNNKEHNHNFTMQPKCVPSQTNTLTHIHTKVPFSAIPFYVWHVAFCRRQFCFPVAFSTSHVLHSFTPSCSLPSLQPLLAQLPSATLRFRRLREVLSCQFCLCVCFGVAF